MVQLNSRMIDDYSLDLLVKSGTEEEFLDLYQKNDIYHDNLLYFCTDNGNIYFGDIKCNNGISYNSKPEVGVSDTLYIDSDGTASIWDGEKYIPLQSDSSIVGELPEGYDSIIDYIDHNNNDLITKVDQSLSDVNNYISQKFEGIPEDKTVSDYINESVESSIDDTVHVEISNQINDIVGEDLPEGSTIIQYLNGKIGKIPPNMTVQEYVNLTAAKTIQNRIGNIPQSQTIQEYINEYVDNAIVGSSIDEEMVKRYINEVVNNKIGAIPENMTVKEYIDNTNEAVTFGTNSNVINISNKSNSSRAVVF